ncbi:hypothetical protein N658DRAFT_19571 [Parathielavia hyrcaniae]|uniref:Uncharacterized protein n=1 Tax=Parathielavia hyrcaniae TaxID=113614 RepID=A0AAN6T6V6_9PEZI|nr:hypothetical protein N658DRAFT_19571 [Parathielavia hyrcaniae]
MLGGTSLGQHTFVLVPAVLGGRSRSGLWYTVVTLSLWVNIWRGSACVARRMTVWLEGSPGWDSGSTNGDFLNNPNSAINKIMMHTHHLDDFLSFVCYDLCRHLVGWTPEIIRIGRWPGTSFPHPELDLPAVTPNAFLCRSI